MLPTYEDVLADEVQLTAAGRQDINGEPCIAVTFEQDGYRCVYAVSTVSGLLAQASFYDGDTRLMPQSYRCWRGKSSIWKRYTVELFKRCR